MKNHHIFAKVLSMFLLLAVSVQVVAARNDKFVIFGYMYEQNDSAGYLPVDSVEVSVTRSDTIVVPFRLLSKAGESDLSTSELRLLIDGPRDSYQLRLYKTGYEPLLREVSYNAASRGMVYAENLLFKPEKRVALSGIEVKATAIKMVMKGDTIVYNADAFDLGEGSMLESLVAMFPGAEISPEGQIKVNGRVLNELLINGKDFFKGDPNVALKNLPSYTVDKVKVYNKAADDAYLTKSDVKLSRKEDEENLVMDVVLKKEYNTGFMANLEAGYGLNDRYSGRVFGLMFTDKLRISGFGNFNNIKDTGSASSDGNWREGWGSPGTLDVQMGGLDMLYSHGKWEATASLKASRQDNLLRSEGANVNYYDSGDIYSRGASSSDNVERDFNFNGEAEYKGNSFYLRVNPDISYSSSSCNTVSRSANFTRQPEERSRTEALDSLFSDSAVPSRFERWLLNRNGTAGVNKYDNLNFGGSAYATIRPEWMTGSLDIMANANHYRNTSESRNVYEQILGPESTEGTVPVSRDSYRTAPSRNTTFNGRISYAYEKNIFTETRKRSWRIYTSVGYDHSHRNNSNDYWLATGNDVDNNFSQNVVLPSLTRPENAVVDPVNTYSTLYEANDLSAIVQGSWNISPVAEVDSGINPTFGISASVRDLYMRHYGRRVTADAVHSRMQTMNFLTPNLMFYFNSANKWRYLYANISYSLSRSAPDVFTLIPSTSTSDPFNVVESGMESLRDSRTHRMSLVIGRYGRKGHMTGVMFNTGMTLTDNAFGVAKRYDPATGISYTRSVNINGNRSAYLNTNVWLDFGKDNKWNWSNYLGANYNRNSDYVTATSGQPLLQRVHSSDVRESTSLSYGFGKGSTVGLTANVGWNGARSAMADFHKVNVWNYGFTTHTTLKLPLDFELRTSLVFSAYRGYESEDMNRDSWFWNASLSKNILKGDMTFKITAVDILGQANNLSIHVNAQGRYETWTNTTPRYAMLSIIYRFRHSPKKLDITPDNSF